MVSILHLLGYKVQGRRHLYFTHSIQLWAADSSASLLFLKQILLCLSSMWLHKSSSSISQKKNWQRFLVPFSSTSHLPRPYTPAKLGTYLELVLLVPPVMLLEAKLQPRSSSCPGRAVSRKLLQGSTLKSYSSCEQSAPWFLDMPCWALSLHAGYLWTIYCKNSIYGLIPSWKSHPLLWIFSSLFLISWTLTPTPVQ